MQYHNLQEVSLRFLETVHPARRSLLSWVHRNSQLRNCSKAKWPSRAQPDFDTFDAFSLHIWSTFSCCVITWDIAWGFAKVRQEKGLREKAADIIWSIRSSELPRSQQWMPPQCGEDSLCQKIRQLICYSHVFWSKIEWSRFTLSNKPIQIDSVRSRDVPSGLGFVLFWSFESLPQCLRIRRVGLSLNCWECWVVRGQLTQ